MRLKELFFTYKVLTFSNFLSLLRIILIAPLAFFMLHKEGVMEYRALSVVIAMVATDYLDGYLARKLGQETPLGQYLDPVADKIAILAGLSLLYFKSGYPIGILLYITLREILGTGFGMFLLTKHNVLGKPNYWGKAGVFAIAVSGIFYLMNWPYKEWTNIPVTFIITGGIIAYWIRYRKTLLNR